MPRILRIVLGIASASVLIACGPQQNAQEETAARTAVEASPTESATADPPLAQVPVVEKKTVTETVAIPFPTTTVKDSSLAKGATKVRRAGVAGVKTITYEVTFTDGVETERKLLREEVTKAPVTQVTAVGTKTTAPPRQCDPNYTPCVPIASDVDCAGGSGNGPAYVRGPVTVIGTDIYDLDRDGNGIGCE